MTFRQLHQSGCFVIPNPWDVGSARILARLGFPALATTSAGLAFSLGQVDEPAPLDADLTLPRSLTLAHISEIVGATNLPVNADFQAGFALDPQGVFESVGMCVDTGAAGLSIEDATGDVEQPLFSFEQSVERVKAARSAIDEKGGQVLLTGRAECFLVDHPDPLRESIKRLQAYAEAGADVLFAPGLKTREEIAAVVSAVAPKPVNFLMSRAGSLRVADLAELGVRRISVGSALARAAWGAFLKAARLLAAEGSFDGFAEAATFAELNDLLKPFQQEH